MTFIKSFDDINLNDTGSEEEPEEPVKDEGTRKKKIRTKKPDRLSANLTYIPSVMGKHIESLSDSEAVSEEEALSSSNGETEDEQEETPKPKNKKKTKKDRSKKNPKKKENKRDKKKNPAKPRARSSSKKKENGTKNKVINKRTKKTYTQILTEDYNRLKACSKEILDLVCFGTA